jgi:hypothetical protein
MSRGTSSPYRIGVVMWKKEVMIMPLYRKRIDGNTWHWCSNCSNYPARDYDHEWHNGKERPKSGDLYNVSAGPRRRQEPAIRNTPLVLASIFSNIV